MILRLKRVYEAPSPVDGLRILVDRLWPRGISKAEAHADLWMKDIAPSTELRVWFSHDLNRWNEFRSRYLMELQQKAELIATIREKADAQTVTLLYGAKDEKHNHAVVLKERIRRTVVSDTKIQLLGKFARRDNLHGLRSFHSRLKWKL